MKYRNIRKNVLILVVFFLVVLMVDGSAHAKRRYGKIELQINEKNCIDVKKFGISKKCRFVSDDKSVAIVSRRGKISAKKIGTCKIYVKKSGKKKGYFVLSVVKNKKQTNNLVSADAENNSIKSENIVNIVNIVKEATKLERKPLFGGHNDNESSLTVGGYYTRTGKGKVLQIENKDDNVVCVLLNNSGVDLHDIENASSFKYIIICIDKSDIENDIKKGSEIEYDILSNTERMNKDYLIVDGMRIAEIME